MGRRWLGPGRQAVGKKRTRAGVRWTTAVMAGLVSACSSQPVQWGGNQSTERQESDIYVATARYVAANYQVTGFDRSPAAMCLAVGPLASRVIRREERSGDANPSAAILARLDDAALPVLPISGCEWNERVEEVRADTGQRGWAMAAGQPRWTTPNLAYVEVFVRESPRFFRAFGCSLERSVEGWRIRKCV